jgi:hypothetical protein
MPDQAEEIRRRLEAHAQGKTPPPPSQQPDPSLPSSFQPSIPAHQNPAMAETARQRKMAAAIEDTSRAQPVVVVDVKIKFWSLVVLMIKVAFAAIPATIIVAMIWAFFAGLLSGLFHR